ADANGYHADIYKDESERSFSVDLLASREPGGINLQRGRRPHVEFSPIGIVVSHAFQYEKDSSATEDSEVDEY
ncbi:hypothetical protein AVEN_44745-1, partial [Araneus ventricosus]